MYSYFEYEDIKIIDGKGLVDYMFKLKNEDKNGEQEWIYGKFLRGLVDGDNYSFDEWTDMKLISYWYDEQVEMLKELGKYLEGKVKWNFENQEETAIVYFKDKKTKFTLGNLQYKDFEPCPYEI